jgi:hypothetical protein
LLASATGANVNAYGVDIDEALIQGAVEKTEGKSEFRFETMSVMEEGKMDTIR